MDTWPSGPHLTASDRGRCFVECPLMNTWQPFVVNFPSIFCYVKRIISRLLFAGCQGLTPDKRPYFCVLFLVKEFSCPMFEFPYITLGKHRFFLPFLSCPFSHHLSALDPIYSSSCNPKATFSVFLKYTGNVRAPYEGNWLL
jgi:hypothetical protein